MNYCSVLSQKLCGRRLRMWEKGGRVKSVKCNTGIREGTIQFVSALPPPSPNNMIPPPRTGAHIRSLSRSFLRSRLKPFLFLLSASLLIEHASWEAAEEQDVEAAKR